MGQGSLATVTEGVVRAKKDLGSVNFRNIDQRYRKQLVELKTTEMCVSDLEKYYKASEHASSLPPDHFKSPGSHLLVLLQKVC